MIGSIASYQSYNTEWETIGAPYGERLYVGTAGGRIYMATGTLARLTELDSTGTPSRVLHLPVARLPITSRHLELSRERFLFRFRPGDRASVREWLAEAPKPDSFPAFTALQAASDGTVWLYRYAFDRDTEPSEWVIVSPERGTFETVTLPPGTTVLDADGDRLLVLQHTELDVPRVSVLHLDAKAR